MPYKVRTRRWARSLSCFVTVVLFLAFAPIVNAQNLKLVDGHPERYVVKEGDTLWGIAHKFLQDPWHWPQIWQNNSQVENPHLIYPGDVLVMTEDGIKLLRREGLRQQTVKLSPGVHYESLGNAIPTIPPNVIQPFLSVPLVVGKGELEKAGYVTVGVEGNIALGKFSQFYARGVELEGDDDDEIYQLFRPADVMRHPDTGEVLGYEAIYLGDARMLRQGDPAKLEVTHSTQEIGQTDRLIKAEGSIALPYYFPHAPETQIRGRILGALNGVSEMGRYSVVSLSVGEREGIEPGHVLRIKQHGRQHTDPVTGRHYQTPEESSGLMMIFRTFEKVSFGLVMSATRSVYMNDVVVTP